jgi:hypothetical protein
MAESDSGAALAGRVRSGDVEAFGALAEPHAPGNPAG